MAKLPDVYLMDSGCIVQYYEAGVPALIMLWRPVNVCSALNLEIGYAFAMTSSGDRRDPLTFYSENRGRVLCKISRKILYETKRANHPVPSANREW